VLRQTVIARRLAAAAGLPDEQQTAVFYTSLLAWVGCVSDSHELAKWFGDDRVFRGDSYEVDKTGMSMMGFVLGHVGRGSSALHRVTMVGRFLAAGPSRAAGSMLGHCQTTGEIADRLGLGGDVRRALQHAFERWDGKGVPGRSAGEQIDPVMRVVQIADDAEVFYRIGGADAAIEMLRSRRATEFDPALVDLFCARATELFDGLDDVDAWDVVITQDGDLGPELTESGLTDVLMVFGDYADLKSPPWLGHSRGVAALAADAARRVGLPASEVTLVERAALVHDLGAIGVSAGVWDKPGPLTTADRERVRTHPYLTERCLVRPPRLGQIGALAALHHERVDGSGYPRGARGDALPLAARLLAAADAYHALGEGRPHRGPCGADEAATVLRDGAVAGAFDGEAVNAVLGAAGHRIRRRPSLPAGLTPREAEVLVLLARGLSNKEIATGLVVSARTVNSHVEHVYAKAGVSTRGAAAMFAMRHGLVVPASAVDTNLG
ncbi:MAG TPA: HD domain-containing phosphohydrolase, partial [Acidimicrobiales bacterium]|nr:HD domain-containing phosphohydrolase [Acidimicrobiales bacterium]